MKKLSIFIKTMMISILIILTTTLILFLLISYLAPNITQQIQKTEFDEVVGEIKQTIQTSGFNQKKLDEFMSKGVSYTITKGDIVVYQSNRVQVNTSGSDELINESSSSKEDIISFDYIESEIFSRNVDVMYNNEKYQLKVIKNNIFNYENSKQLIRFIFPYFILVGSIIAVLFSGVYAYFFSRKIKRLSNNMNEMKEKTFIVNEHPPKGDEIQMLENNIQDLYKQLLEEITLVNRLEEERQVFLRGVTHELKTPIMTMGITIEGMIAGIDGYENTEHSLHECYQELQRMSALVNEILELSKTEYIKDIQNVFIGSEIKQVIDVYRNSFEERRVEIIFDIDDSIVCKLPHDSIHKVFSNLVSNAAKYTSKNGTFKVSVDKYKIKFSNTVENENIDIKKIFNAFVSTGDKLHSFQKSHGLGLYIVDSILQQCNMNYECKIEDGEFSISIDIVK